MAATKQTTVLFDDVTLTAGAANQNADVTVDAGYGAVLGVKLTNGATGPTVAAQVQVQVSNDGANFYDFGGPLQGATANDAIVSWTVEVPMGVQRVRLSAGSNTGQNVTVRAEISNVTAV